MEPVSLIENNPQLGQACGPTRQRSSGDTPTACGNRAATQSCSGPEEVSVSAACSALLSTTGLRWRYMLTKSWAQDHLDTLTTGHNLAYWRGQADQQDG